MVEALKSQQQQHQTADLQDALFIALELVRAELLTNHPYSIQYTKKQVLEDEAATNAIRLISRATSLIGARFKVRFILFFSFFSSNHCSSQWAPRWDPLFPSFPNKISLYLLV